MNTEDFDALRETVLAQRNCGRVTCVIRRRSTTQPEPDMAELIGFLAEHGLVAEPTAFTSMSREEAHGILLNVLRADLA